MIAVLLSIAPLFFMEFSIFLVSCASLADVFLILGSFIVSSIMPCPILISCVLVKIGWTILRISEIIWSKVLSTLLLLSKLKLKLKVKTNILNNLREIIMDGRAVSIRINIRLKLTATLFSSWDHLEYCRLLEFP